MYITDQYLCFHSRIISYVTKHVHAWENIEQVTKERVAFIFPTAIGIKLKSSERKIIYASFLQRDQAFDKIISILLKKIMIIDLELIPKNILLMYGGPHSFIKTQEKTIQTIKAKTILHLLILSQEVLTRNLMRTRIQKTMI